MFIGQRIKDYRENNDLTREQFGELCNISADTVKGFELYNKNPRYDVLIRICNNLNLSPIYFMCDDLKINDDKSNSKKAEIDSILDTLSPSELDMASDVIKALSKHL